VPASSAISYTWQTARTFCNPQILLKSLISKHLIWDYTEGDLENVSPLDFNKVPDISKKLFTSRHHGGRTAFICPADYLYGMFRMYTAYADIQAMPYDYDVFKTFREAIVWVRNSK
jgi:hypothetical protein